MIDKEEFYSFQRMGDDKPEGFSRAFAQRRIVEKGELFFFILHAGDEYREKEDEIKKGKQESPCTQENGLFLFPVVDDQDDKDENEPDRDVLAGEEGYDQQQGSGRVFLFLKGIKKGGDETGGEDGQVDVAGKGGISAQQKEVIEHDARSEPEVAGFKGYQFPGGPCGP